MYPRPQRSEAVDDPAMVHRFNAVSIKDKLADAGG
jgi:hypothetical protein